MKTTVEVKRPNGEIEILDLTEKFPFGITQAMFNLIRKSTAEAGRGDVEKAILTQTKSNMAQLQKEYNNLHNEGGEGYIPDYDYFLKNKGYKEWIETKELR